MASCFLPAKEAEDGSTIVPNWLYLPRDITVNIFQRLGAFEICASACEVCSQWWNISKDHVMWRTIHMTTFGVKLYPDYYLDLVKICCIAIKRSCGHVEDIDVEYFGSDELLEYIAEIASYLRCMRIAHCWSITDKGISASVRKLPQLEKLDISHSNPSKESLKVLGLSCPLLKSLTFAKSRPENPCCDDDVMFVIAETMSGLSCPPLTLVDVMTISISVKN